MAGVCVGVLGVALAMVVVVVTVAWWQRAYWFRQTLFGDGYSWVDNTDHVVIA